MDQLKEIVKEKVKELDMDLCGFADATLANKKAPSGFAPEDQLQGANTVIIFGRSIPSGVFNISNEKQYRDIYYNRSEWTIYESLDKAAFQLARFLDIELGYVSIPIPTTEPYLIQNGKLRGRVSLKHMGQLAGIGSIGKNSLLINREYGNIFRLGGIITKAPIPPDNPVIKDYCPEDCTACAEACPVNAVRDRSIDMVACIKKSIHHPLMKPYALTRLLFRLSKSSEMVCSIMSDFSNLIINTNYLESCNECMRACPYFKKAINKENVESYTF